MDNKSVSATSALGAKNAPGVIGRKRFLSLDALRGFGAFFIAFFWHYQHFGKRGIPPFDLFFDFFYKQGLLFVEMFFMISGFVMACGYKEKIMNRQITFKNYMVKRYKHILPLALITLLVVTIEQFGFMYATGKTFVYGNFDVYHFLLNIVGMQSGWFENEMSFNGPAWCISVEIFCYILFYAVLYFSRKNRNHYWGFCVALCFLGLSAISMKWKLPFLDYRYMARGIVCFFLGVLLYEAYKNAPQITKKIATVGFPVLVIAAIIALVIRTKYNIWGDYGLVVTLFVFPELIMAAIFVRPFEKLLTFKPFVFFGKCSMSIYLWHFPVQCCIALFDKAFHLNLDYKRTLVWVIYVLSVLIVSMLSYYIIEKRNFKFLNKFFTFVCGN